MLAPLPSFAGDVAVACVVLFLRMYSPLSSLKIWQYDVR